MNAEQKNQAPNPWRVAITSVVGLTTIVMLKDNVDLLTRGADRLADLCGQEKMFFRIPAFAASFVPVAGAFYMASDCWDDPEKRDAVLKSVGKVVVQSAVMGAGTFGSIATVFGLHQGGYSEAFAMALGNSETAKNFAGAALALLATVPFAAGMEMALGTFSDGYRTCKAGVQQARAWMKPAPHA